MEKTTDKNIYTVVFAIIMVSVVGVILAGLFSFTKPLVTKNRQIERQQNILYAMGINDNTETGAVFISGEKAPEAFANYVKKQLVIQDGKVTEDDEAYLIDVKKEKSNAKNPDYSRRLPLFVGEKDGKTIYVAPIYGKGLWDDIWGFVGMDENMVIQSAYFDHKAETPGLGANIKERFFMDDFVGEHLLDDNGNFTGITVAKGNADPRNDRKEDNKVDAIAGATITGDGVTAMIKSDLALYKSYFDQLK
jgi:Na+-transporting NADH:ubiquinone oxidoreductase subunit C